MKPSTTHIPAKLQDMKLQSIRPLRRLSRKLQKSKLFSTLSNSGSSTAKDSTLKGIGSKASSSKASSQKASSPKLSAPSEIHTAEASGAAGAAAPAVDTKTSKGVKLLLNLLLVRPWVLVLGFWLLAMVTGSLALDGMISPRKLTMALPEPATEEDTTARSDARVNVEQAADTVTVGDASVSVGADETASETAGETVSAESASSFPVLPITVLVGTCALGSLAISRRRAMARLAAARAKGRVRRHQPGRVATTASARGAQPLKRHAAPGKVTPLKAKAQAGSGRGKQRRARVKRGAIATQPGAGNSRVLASRTNAQQATAQKATTRKATAQKTVASTAQSRTASARGSKRQQVRRAPRRVSMRATSRRQPVVSVVPANESHALDWNGGSLAHQLDVRPQRSAM